MSMLHCFHCDRDIDTNDEDHAEFEPEFRCGSCVDEQTSGAPDFITSNPMGSGHFNYPRNNHV